MRPPQVRVYLTANPDWRAQDDAVRAVCAAHRAAVLHRMLAYLDARGTPEARLDDFCDAEPDGLPRRGDLVRMMKRRPDVVRFDPARYTYRRADAAPAGAGAADAPRPPPAAAAPALGRALLRRVARSSGRPSTAATPADRTAA